MDSIKLENDKKDENEITLQKKKMKMQRILRIILYIVLFISALGLSTVIVKYNKVIRESIKNILPDTFITIEIPKSILYTNEIDLDNRNKFILHYHLEGIERNEQGNFEYTMKKEVRQELVEYQAEYIGDCKKAISSNKDNNITDIKINTDYKKARVYITESKITENDKLYLTLLKNELIKYNLFNESETDDIDLEIYNTNTKELIDTYNNLKITEDLSNYSVEVIKNKTEQNYNEFYEVYINK